MRYQWFPTLFSSSCKSVNVNELHSLQCILDPCPNRHLDIVVVSRSSDRSWKPHSELTYEVTRGLWSDLYLSN